MSEIPLIDYSSLDEGTRERLAAIVSNQTSLERVLNWGRAQRPPMGIESILTQDEYTHDVLIPFEGWGARPVSSMVLGRRITHMSIPRRTPNVD